MKFDNIQQALMYFRLRSKVETSFANKIHWFTLKYSSMNHPGVVLDDRYFVTVTYDASGGVLNFMDIETGEDKMPALLEDQSDTPKLLVDGGRICARACQSIIEVMEMGVMPSIIFDELVSSLVFGVAQNSLYDALSELQSFISFSRIHKVHPEVH